MNARKLKLEHNSALELKKGSGLLVTTATQASCLVLIWVLELALQT